MVQDSSSHLFYGNPLGSFLYAQENSQWSVNQCFVQTSASLYSPRRKNIISFFIWNSLNIFNSIRLPLITSCSNFWIIAAGLEDEWHIKKCLPDSFQLSLRREGKTLQDWTEYRFSSSGAIAHDVILSVRQGCNGMCVNVVMKLVRSRTQHRQIVCEDFFSGAHHGFNLNRKNSNADDRDRQR